MLEESTLQTADSFKRGLSNTVKQIEDGFEATMSMYMVAFYLGISSEKGYSICMRDQ
jgi:hypothetical protein